MNKETVKGNWHQIRGKMRSKWGKLSDDDVNSLEGKLENLSGILQEKYGYAKDRAKKEYQDFKASLSNQGESKK